MTAEEYFARRDTPQAGSPCGCLMVRILDKNPGMDHETARVEAHRLLALAAKSRNYQVPGVFSPEEQARNRERLNKAFGIVSKTRHDRPEPLFEAA